MQKSNSLIAVLCAVLLAATVWSANPIVRVAEGYSRSIVASSIAIYGSLRAINAFLSTAQEIEVGAPFVASGSVQPLKMLEPLDDTVERVAGVVLTVTMVSGVMILGFAPVVGIGYMLVLLGWMLSWRAHFQTSSRTVMRLGLLMAFVVPVAFIAAGALGDLVTHSALGQHEALLASLAKDISPHIDDAGSSVASTGDRFTDWLLAPLSNMTDTASAVTRATAAAQTLVERSDELLSSYVQIVGAYVLKGAVLPLLLVMIAAHLFRRDTA